MRTTYLVENTLFTTDLAENRVLFTSATSFTPKNASTCVLFGRTKPTILSRAGIFSRSGLVPGPFQFGTPG